MRVDPVGDDWMSRRLDEQFLKSILLTAASPPPIRVRGRMLEQDESKSHPVAKLSHYSPGG